MKWYWIVLLAIGGTGLSLIGLLCLVWWFCTKDGNPFC
jgi:hypothetical protein